MLMGLCTNKKNEGNNIKWNNNSPFRWPSWSANQISSGMILTALLKRKITRVLKILSEQKVECSDVRFYMWLNRTFDWSNFNSIETSATHIMMSRWKILIFALVLTSAARNIYWSFKCSFLLKSKITIDKHYLILTNI